MGNTWDKIWKTRKYNSDDSSHSGLLALNGYDGSHSIITPKTLSSALKTYSREIDLQRGDNIFEVGCGSGAFLYQWHQEGYDVGGFDISENLISYAKKAIPKGTWFVDEANKFTVERAWDHVISFSTFFYFPSRLYARDVLYRMIMKSKRSVSIFDIPDLALKHQCEEEREKTIPDYKTKYSDLSHLYYSKEWWSDNINDLGLRFKIYDQNIKGYENSKWRYNITILL